MVAGHHTLEDRSVFPHLRRADPDLGAVLDRLEEEHHVIADVLDELQRAVDLLTDTLRSHLAYEERELLHPLAEHGFG